MDWQECLDHYEKLISLFPQIERKGKTTPYTSVNGNMYSFLDKAGNLGLRLPEAERNVFITKYDTTLMEQHGRTMKEYVLVPKELLSKTKELSNYFRKSIAYATSLKAKPTKKKKK